MSKNTKGPLSVAIEAFRKEQEHRLRAVQKIKTVPGVTQIVLAQLTSHLDALATIPKRERYPKGIAFIEFLESFEKLTIFRRISLLDLDWFLQTSLKTGPGFSRGVDPPRTVRSIINALCKNFPQEKEIDDGLSKLLIELRNLYPEILQPSDDSYHWMVDLDTVLSIAKPIFNTAWNTEEFLKHFSGASIIWRTYRCPAVHEPFSPLRDDRFLTSNKVSVLPVNLSNSMRDGYGAFPTALLLEEAVKEGIETLCKNFEEKGKLPPEVVFEYLNPIDAGHYTDIELP